MANQQQPNRKNRKTVGERERDKLLWQLDKFRQTVSYGFSDENFARAAYLFGELSNKLDLQEYHVLGDAWRGAYADDCYMYAMDDACVAIKDRIFDGPSKR